MEPCRNWLVNIELEVEALFLFTVGVTVALQVNESQVQDTIQFISLCGSETQDSTQGFPIRDNVEVTCHNAPS